MSQEMDEWQNLDDDERERQYLKSIGTQNQNGMLIYVTLTINRRYYSEQIAVRLALQQGLVFD